MPRAPLHEIHGIPTLRALAFLRVCLAAALAGCSNVGGDGADTSTGTCYDVDVCDALPLATVNAALGGPFVAPVETNTGDGSFNTSDLCSYVKHGSGGLSVTRTCSSDGSASSDYDSRRRGMLDPPYTRTDVTGVGDKAFIDDISNGTPDGNESMLLAVQGNVTVIIDDNSVTAGENVQEGLATLANILLAQ